MRQRGSLGFAAAETVWCLYTRISDTEAVEKDYPLSFSSRGSSALFCGSKDSGCFRRGHLGLGASCGSLPLNLAQFPLGSAIVDECPNSEIHG